MTGEHWTPLPWCPPHLIDDTVKCNCQGITSMGYLGGLARININNGLRVDDGGNDAPPLEEAKANARLMTASPLLYRDLKQACELLAQLHDSSLNDCMKQQALEILSQAERVLAQARGELPFRQEAPPVEDTLR